jgi:hypothetical protein
VALWQAAKQPSDEVQNFQASHYIRWHGFLQRKNMKTFIQWCEENKHQVPTMTDAPEAQPNTDAPENKKPTEEKQARTGYSGNYPPAYYRAHYPDAYEPPRKATAFLDKQNMGKK